MVTAATTLTPGAPALLDRTVDVDTHEMIPFHLWGEHFGEEVADLLAPCVFSPRFNDNGLNTIVRPEILGDDVEMTTDVVWRMKGASAPAAIDMSRRDALMDTMGIAKSLMFPSFGLLGIRMAASPDIAGAAFAIDMNAVDARHTGLKVMDAYNDWAVRSLQQTDGGRLRPVAVMLTETLDEMLAKLHDLIEKGVKAVWIPTANPPADTSPADAALDPFWQLAAEADVAVLLHIGTDFSFPASARWATNVPAFATPKANAEFPVSPFSGATVHYASDNFLSAMVLGGVFERFPDLRFGAIEVGADWLGPLAERLDMWAAHHTRVLSRVITMKPSDYLARNVRVTPLAFEPVDTYFDRYPNLQDCYCFSTDYPHVEGGVDIKAVDYEMLRRHGDAVIERYFVTNGEWLIPDF